MIGASAAGSATARPRCPNFVLLGASVLDHVSARSIISREEVVFRVKHIALSGP
jgi:hypothetical protein